jgi:hypothetical protein
VKLEYEKALVREQGYQKEIERLNEQLKRISDTIKRKYEDELET